MVERMLHFVDMSRNQNFGFNSFTYSLRIQSPGIGYKNIGINSTINVTEPFKVVFIVLVAGMRNGYTIWKCNKKITAYGLALMSGIDSNLNLMPRDIQLLLFAISGKPRDLIREWFFLKDGFIGYNRLALLYKSFCNKGVSMITMPMRHKKRITLFYSFQNCSIDYLSIFAIV